MFENKIIAITGGTDGIGKALVKEFLNKGAKAATCSRTQEKLDDLKTEFAGKTLFTMVADAIRNFLQKHLIL